MISIKQAADSAHKYLVDLVGTVDDVRLEEVDSDPQHWFITLGYAENVARSWHSRVYKVFTISKETGEVSAMKIRNVQGV
jgi:hypothetical protein